MLDKLIDVLLAIWKGALPFVVIDHFRRGVVLRFGRYHRTLEPGFHWMWPLAEECMGDNVVTRTEKLSEQTLTTKDGTEITFRLVVTANITDIFKSILGVEGVDDALNDSCCGTVSQMVIAHDWANIRSPEFLKLLTRQCHLRARRYGWEITEVAWSDLTVTPAYRVFGVTRA